MFNHIQQPQPPYTEQLVVSVVEGLEKLADILPYEFDETIDTIEALYALKFQKTEEEPKKTAAELMQEYIDASKSGEPTRIVAGSKGGK